MSRTDVNRYEYFPGFRNTKLFRINPPSFISESETLVPDQSYISEVRIGNVTPDFRGLRRRKEDLPMLPFFYEKFSWSAPYGRQEIITPNSNLRQVDIGGNIGGGWEHNPFVLTDAERSNVADIARNKLFRGLKDQRVNLGVAFAERQQSKKMILDTARRLGSSLLALKSGSFKTAARYLLGTTYDGPQPSRLSLGRKRSQSKALADDWLALQFGWKPLLSDVWGALESLAANADRLNRSRVSVSHTVRWNRLGDVFGAQWDNIPNGARRYGQFTAKYVVVFSTPNPATNLLASYGITNPLFVAWELLPWSFVIDWFIPVGKYIDALDAAVGLSFEKGCFTTFEKGWTQYSSNGRYVDPGTGRESYVNAKAFAFRVKCVRESISDFPTVPLPKWTPKPSLDRATSTVALIRQRLRT